MTKLFLIAGHGAGDPGAGGNGYNEADLVRRLAQTIYDMAPAGSVILGDFKRNYYADGGLNSLQVDKDTMVVELHMDAAAASAKGGHVIIKSGYSPDWFDNNLAKALTNYLPGRSNSIVGRSDLANVNRAANRGINYRLVENGFITNAGDVQKVLNDNMKTLAKIYLDAAGIGVKQTAPAAPAIPHNVYTTEYNGGDLNSLWWVRGTIKDGGRIAIRNAGTYEWLSDPNSAKTNGTPAQCWGGQGGSDGNADPRDPQWWTLHAVPDNPGVYRLSPDVAPNMRLDVDSNNPGAGVKVQLWGANESEAQQFVFYKTSTKQYRIVSCSGFKCLTVK